MRHVPRTIAIASCALAAACAPPAERIVPGPFGAAAEAIGAARRHWTKGSRAAAAVETAETADARKERDPRDPPDGYVTVTPLARSSPELGNAVLLVEPSEEVMVPIFIGGTEALSIQLRLEHRKYGRPLTHDLLDDLLAKLGGKMVRAQVDDLRDNVYVGTVVVERDGRIIALDARPSDAIALAIGNRVPIYVPRKLLDAVGIRAADLDRAAARPSAEPIAL
jgi:bifunctional DNase/RNase